LRLYETIYICNPRLEDSQMETVHGRLKGVLEAQGGHLFKLDTWGKMRMAYRIKKCNTGVYMLMEYAAPPGVVSELERQLKLMDSVVRFQDSVLRYQTVLLDDELDEEEVKARLAEVEPTDESEAEKAPAEEATAEEAPAEGEKVGAEADAGDEKEAEADTGEEGDAEAENADKEE